MVFLKNVGRALLIFINTIFLLLSLFLFGTGIYLIQTDYLEDEWLFQRQVTACVSTFLIVLGIITTVITFLGFWGAATDKRRLLKIYACILLCVLFIQVCLGIFIGASMAIDEDFIKEAFMPEQINTGEIVLSDAFHLTYECCGYHDPRSMRDIFGFYPASCCGFRDEKLICMLPLTYNIGCLEQITDSVTMVGVAYAAFVGFQILCAGIAFFVVFSIPRKRDSDDDSSSYNRMSL